LWKSGSRDAKVTIEVAFILSGGILESLDDTGAFSRILLSAPLRQKPRFTRLYALFKHLFVAKATAIGWMAGIAESVAFLQSERMS
jgi:hypothetical protein